MRRGIERRLLVVIAFRGSDSRIEETGLAYRYSCDYLGKKRGPSSWGGWVRASVLARLLGSY
jgi:hypothetical protein